MRKNIEVLFTAERIQERVAELAKSIEKGIPADGEFVVVGVLKGAFIFMSDLVRGIRRPLACDFLRVSSYDHDKSTGLVRMEFDMTQPVAGKHVLLVEDIVDTGRTLRHLIEHLKTKEPASLKVASLLFKDVGSDMRKFVDYIGFEVPNKFVVGYGLDTEGLHRSLPYIGVVNN